MKVITTVVGELGTNCYLLIDEATREAALIDPADSPDELSALIEREGVTLRYILLTHGHRDHSPPHTCVLIHSYTSEQVHTHF